MTVGSLKQFQNEYTMKMGSAVQAPQNVKTTDHIAEFKKMVFLHIFQFSAMLSCGGGGGGGGGGYRGLEEGLEIMLKVAKWILAKLEMQHKHSMAANRKGEKPKIIFMAN